MILQYVCYLHEAKALLRRISRTALVFSFSGENGMFANFAKKMVEIPIKSNQTLVVTPTHNLLSKQYKIVDADLKELSQAHLDFASLKTVSYLGNLASAYFIKKLNHPLAFSPLVSDLDDSAEVISLLEQDRLEEF